MNDIQLRQVCVAIEASARDGECVVLAGPREGDVVLSEAATALLSSAAIDAETARGRLIEAMSDGGDLPVQSRRIGGDFPQSGWGAFLITAGAGDASANNDGRDMGKVRHDLRGVANNISLSLELAYRKAKAIEGAEPVVVALEKTRAHARTFIAQIEELRDD